MSETSIVDLINGAMITQLNTENCEIKDKIAALTAENEAGRELNRKAGVEILIKEGLIIKLTADKRELVEELSKISTVLQYAIGSYNARVAKAMVDALIAKNREG